MPFCTTHFRTYPAEHSGCITCYQKLAKISTSNARKEAKQANVLAKVKSSKNKPVTIPQVSKKQASINAELSRIKKELIAENPYCIACKDSANLTLSHIIIKKHKEFITDLRNLCILCADCHYIFEHDKSTFNSLYPTVFRWKLEQVKQMSNEHYQKLKAKI